MKTKLLKKIRKRFIIEKDGSLYKVTDFRWNIFTTYSSKYTYTIVDSLDWIFKHYYSEETVARRRMKLNKTNL